MSPIHHRYIPTRPFVQAIITVALGVGCVGAFAANVNLSATGGNGRIDLSWTATDSLRGVQVMRDTDADPAGRQRVAILGGNARSYTDTSVTNGRQYWYWIKYTDTAGSVGNSNAGSATPAAGNNGNNGNTGSTCTNAVPLALPKVFTGAMDTCLVTSGTIESVNSWGAETVEINGVSYKSKWSNQMPARINGNYYIRYVAKQYWAHFEINGKGGTDNGGDTPVVNYTLDVGISGNGSASVSAGSHSYKSGTAVTIAATPGSGSVFSGWSGAVTGNTNPLTITMNGNKSLTAMFATQSDSGNDPQGAAFGFGRTVTGGAGGAKVRVTTADQLRNALCGSTSGGYCSDNTPRVIEVASTIDLADSEGTAQVQGCYANQICTAPAKSEITLLTNSSFTHCDGKTKFNVTYKKAATRGLLVGSNKTLIGVGRAGVIKGKGLLLMGGVSNIIVRNLSFTDIGQGLVFGGDAITVSDASRVWIDHNYFARIGRQMIVTGTGDQTGKVTDMTVSWNEFDGRNDYSPYCNGKHYWNHLFYGKGNFTFANNWLHDFSGRAPKIDSQAIAHVVNNFFENGAGHALDTGNSVHALVEGNDFENVTTPITSTSSHVYALSTSSSSDGACRGALGRSCVPNELSSGFAKQDAAVLNAIGTVSHEAIMTPATANGVSATVRSGAGVGKI